MASSPSGLRSHGRRALWNQLTTEARDINVLEYRGHKNSSSSSRILDRGCQARERPPIHPREYTYDKIPNAKSYRDLWRSIK